MPRIEVLKTGPEVGAAPVPPQPQSPVVEAGRAPRRRRSFLASPTLLLALLALLAIVGAILYNSSLFQGDGEREERTVAQAPAPADYPAATPSFNETLPADPVPPAEVEAAAPPTADTSVPAEIPTETRPQETAAPAADTAPPPTEEQASGSGGVAAVRAFYSALSRGDGASAAQHVIAGKRQSGPLSGAALSRYYSSFRRPLRVRGITPVDANTVRVSYDYVLSDGRTCEGQATVNVVQSGGRDLVSGINTRGPC